ncbi:MAG: GspE/PulE family protein, partial [Pseudomonadota bacterium]
CTERDFNDLLGALYGQHARLGEVIEDMGEMQYERDEEAESAPVKDLEVSSLKDLAEEAPVIRLVNSILAQAIRDSASDIHLSPEKDRINLRFRIDGKLHNVPAPPVRMFLPIISRLKILANMDISISRIPQDGRFTIRMDHHDINIRASTMPTIYGENLVLRLLDTSAGVFSLNELGMSDYDLPKINSVLDKPYGMILATGPTGSGKSTTLFSIIKEINRPDVNIITLEDPVEYRVEGVRQIQLNRKAGMTFANGLRSILRQDPDVIMVGEIRDAETAQISVQAALTGHRVFSTVHTNDAAGAITRLLDMGIEPFLASSVLLVSIAQRLVRRVCPSCRKPYDPPKSALELFGLESSPDTDYLVGGGCYHCLETGYRGRIGIYEILIIDQAVQELILKKASSRDITRAAVEAGMLHTLKDDAADKIRRGITTFQEAASAIMG